MSALGVFLFLSVPPGFSEIVVLIVAACDGVWEGVTDVRGWFVHGTRMQEIERPPPPTLLV